MDQEEVYESLFTQAQKYRKLGCEEVVACIARMVESSIVLHGVHEVEKGVKRGDNVEVEGVVEELRGYLGDHHEFLNVERVYEEMRGVLTKLILKLKNE